MKIIDTKTGKRVGQEQKEFNIKLKEEDPILRNATKELDEEELSPMDPPDAYDAERTEVKNAQAEHPLIVQYMEEHVAAIKVLDAFEKGINSFKENGYQLTDEINTSFRKFFSFFDDNLLDHNRREEKELFPLLHKKLIEDGEHSEADAPTTAVDMMEDDHVKFIQLGALAFNLLGLAARLPDPNSKRFTYDVAYDNARELIEMIRLHIYREDNILFPLATKLISTQEMDAMKP
ncbi:MAG: hemerythrin domain-containing protein [Flavobacteriales bacterium]|nr:hemerythrin domain-containing protein [Flavobacteriales bacterium]